MTVEPKVPRDELLRLYRTMLLIRRCEEQLARSHQRGLVHGACHTYVGQEAVAVGVCEHLRRDDVVFSTHRGHGHALAKGVPPLQLIAELLGRANGCSRGRGGSMHLFASEVGMMGTSGIVGPCILQAAGAGYTFKLLKTDRVAVAFFGDGAVNNGAFHEGLNLAAIWKLPVLFVCENNQFATEVPFAYAAGNPSVASRGAAYGIPGIELDGNDVLAVHAAATAAVARARSGNGPTLFECKTYAHDRTRRAWATSPTAREDVENWKAKCPIERLRGTIAARGRPSPSWTRPTRRFNRKSRRPPDRRSESWPDATTATRTSTPSHAACRPHRHPASESSPTRRPRSKRSVRRWPRIRTSSYWARASAFAAETSDHRGSVREVRPAALRDTPICDRGFVGLGCGAAMTGTRPVIDFMFADFVSMARRDRQPDREDAVHE